MSFLEAILAVVSDVTEEPSPPHVCVQMAESSDLLLDATADLLSDYVVLTEAQNDLIAAQGVPALQAAGIKAGAIRDEERPDLDRLILNYDLDRASCLRMARPISSKPALP